MEAAKKIGGTTLEALFFRATGFDPKRIAAPPKPETSPIETGAIKKPQQLMPKEWPADVIRQPAPSRLGPE